jgi:regulatory protein
MDTDERLEHALGVAYRYLNRRDRTETEVRRHLVAKGIDEATTERALTTLVDQGYVDDARFARMLAHDKRELEQWGSERIRRTLAARGVEGELVDEALAAEPELRDPGHGLSGGDGLPGDGDLGDGELDRAVALLQRRFPVPPRERRDRERALGVLLRKGYDGELALDALARHERASGADGFR